LKNRHSIDDYLNGILAGDRLMLSKAITLIESKLSSDKILAEIILKEISPKTGNSIRIGITGAPGAGKSTLIEALGNYITQQNKKVAVIAIDPTSAITKGSILGDKTRMDSLSNNQLAYIRPSPSNEYLGGTNEVSREIIMLCEAAGFEIILIETVGVGQSEALVRGMVDFLMLLYLAGSGDELQGIKKGILEHANYILITKADGENLENALSAKNELISALQITPNNGVVVDSFSAFNQQDIENLWKNILEKINEKSENGEISKKRSNQKTTWFHEIIERKIVEAFYANSEISKNIDSVEIELKAGKIDTFEAVNEIIRKLNF
jgi:LAO/AO transport system kinase